MAPLSGDSSDDEKVLQVDSDESDQEARVPRTPQLERPSLPSTDDDDDDDERDSSPDSHPPSRSYVAEPLANQQPDIRRVLTPASASEEELTDDDVLHDQTTLRGGAEEFPELHPMKHSKTSTSAGQDAPEFPGGGSASAMEEKQTLDVTKMKDCYILRAPPVVAQKHQLETQSDYERRTAVWKLERAYLPPPHKMETDEERKVWEKWFDELLPVILTSAGTHRKGYKLHKTYTKELERTGGLPLLCVLQTPKLFWADATQLEGGRWATVDNLKKWQPKERQR